MLARWVRRCRACSRCGLCWRCSLWPPGWRWPSLPHPPGTPVQYTLEDVDNTLRIRIGDPDRTFTGRRDYTITYRVEGTLNGFPDHDELYWNAIGADWEVPIEQASVTVKAPAAVGQVACYAG